MGKKWAPSDPPVKPDYSSIPRRESFEHGWKAQMENPLMDRKAVSA